MDNDIDMLELDDDVLPNHAAPTTTASSRPVVTAAPAPALVDGARSLPAFTQDVPSEAIASQVLEPALNEYQFNDDIVDFDAIPDPAPAPVDARQLADTTAQRADLNAAPSILLEQQRCQPSNRTVLSAPAELVLSAPVPVESAQAPARAEPTHAQRMGAHAAVALDVHEPRHSTVIDPAVPPPSEPHRIDPGPSGAGWACRRGACMCAWSRALSQLGVHPCAYSHAKAYLTQLESVSGGARAAAEALSRPCSATCVYATRNAFEHEVARMVARHNLGVMSRSTEPTIRRIPQLVLRVQWLNIAGADAIAEVTDTLGHMGACIARRVVEEMGPALAVGCVLCVRGCAMFMSDAHMHVLGRSAAYTRARANRWLCIAAANVVAWWRESACRSEA